MRAQTLILGAGAGYRFLTVSALASGVGHEIRPRRRWQHVRNRASGLNPGPKERHSRRLDIL